MEYLERENVKVIGRSGGLTAGRVGEREGRRVIVQYRRWRRKVGSDEIRRFMSMSVVKHRAERSVRDSTGFSLLGTSPVNILLELRQRPASRAGSILHCLICPVDRQ